VYASGLTVKARVKPGTWNVVYLIVARSAMCDTAPMPAPINDKLNYRLPRTAAA
jgi:hypothetical protein